MRRKSTALILVGLIFTLCFIAATGSSIGIDWTKHSGNPLELEPDRTVESWVVFHEGIFKMWFTGIDSSGLHKIYYATSSDGISWTPHGMVLDVGVSGSWDESSVRRPVVLFDGTIYKMWYLGSHIHKIGLATSPDGIVWTKYSGNPVLVPGGNGGWDDGGLGEFTVFFNGTTYIMWYNGVVSQQKIGVATSLDGISWTKYSGNPVLIPGSSGWDNYHVYTGPVIRNETCYQMWYSGQQGSTVRIGLATSPNGFSWTKYSANPILDVGPPGAWDSAYILAMSTVEKADKLMMWYWGGSDPAGRTERLGLATSYLPCVPVEVDLDPDTLNLRSRGRWITCYIELPEGYDVNDINVSTVMLDDTVPAELSPTEVGDYDGDDIPDLMVKFDRVEVTSYILANVDMTELFEKRFMTITLTITGYLDDGTPFEGSDTIRIGMPMRGRSWRFLEILEIFTI